MKKNNVISFVAVLISLIWLTLQSFQVLQHPFLGTDFVSWALQSMAGIWGIGHSYTNYWNINPPGLMMMTNWWGLLFGGSFISFYWLYMLSLSGILFFTWQILGKIFNNLEKLFIFTIFGITFFSATVQTQFFPSEINGLLFTLIGLWLALSNKKNNVFWASFFLLFAGQMKEVYLPAILLLLPHLLININRGKSTTLSFLKSAAKGALLGLGLIIGYLLLTQSFSAYLEILATKSQQFPISPSEVGYQLYPAIQFPKDRFIFLQYPLYVLFSGRLLLGFYWLSTNLKSKLSKDKQTMLLKINLKFSPTYFNYLVIGCYWLGSMLGYAMQGRLGSKYEISVLLSTFLIIAIISKLIIVYILEFMPYGWFKNSLIKTVTTLVILALLLIPKKDFFLELQEKAYAYNPQEHFKLYQQALDHQLAVENYVKEKTNQDDCISTVYGWGVGTSYYYSQRQPCSRYFLVNILPSNKHQEYQEDLLNHPPVAIFYTDQATDMNVAEFESNVFNYSAVLDKCYRQDETYHGLYWASVDKNQLADCLKVGLPN